MAHVKKNNFCSKTCCQNPLIQSNIPMCCSRRSQISLNNFDKIEGAGNENLTNNHVLLTVIMSIKLLKKNGVPIVCTVIHILEYEQRSSCSLSAVSGHFQHLSSCYHIQSRICKLKKILILYISYIQEYNKRLNKRYFESEYLFHAM